MCLVVGIGACAALVFAFKQNAGVFLGLALIAFTAWQGITATRGAVTPGLRSIQLVLLGAVLLLRAHSRLGWAATMALSSSPFIGYVLSRTTGLPGAMGDIGNWTEPLGLASLYVEACVCVLGLYGLTRFRRMR